MNYYLSGYGFIYFINGYLKIQFGASKVSFLLFSLTMIYVAMFCRCSGLSVLKTFSNKSSGVVYLLGSNVSLASGALGNEINFVFHLVFTQFTETFLSWYWCWLGTSISLYFQIVCAYTDFIYNPL